MKDFPEMIFEELNTWDKPATKQMMKHNRFVLSQIFGTILAFTTVITVFNIAA